MVGTISVGVPILITIIVYLKRREFLNFIGEEAASKPETIDEEWNEYVGLDCSRFNFLYSFFEYNWAYFTVIIMMIKALSILCMLIVPPDSPEQIIGAIVVQGAFTVLVFMAAPFILDSIGDGMLLKGQPHEAGVRDSPHYLDGHDPRLAAVHGGAELVERNQVE